MADGESLSYLWEHHDLELTRPSREKSTKPGQLQLQFDAVAIVASDEECAALIKDGASIDFAKGDFGHLKAIGFSPEARLPLTKAGVVADAGVVELGNKADVLLNPTRALA